MAYEYLAFPHEKGGPGPYDTLVLVVTATGTDGSTTPVKAAADMAAYDAEDANDVLRHKRFSDIVLFFSRYGTPISIASDGDQTITLKYEHQYIHGNNSEGKAPWFTPGHRPNAYDIAAEYVAANDHSVTGMTTTVNGVLQSGT